MKQKIISLPLILIIFKLFSACNSPSTTTYPIGTQSSQNIATASIQPDTAATSQSPDGQEHSPPPGIGGWPSPRTLTEAEKTMIKEIVMASPETLYWLHGRTDFQLLTVYWTEVIWTNDQPLDVSIHIEDAPINSPDIDPNAYWYPATTLQIDNVSQILIAVDLDAGKVAYTMPLPYSPLPSSVTSNTSNITSASIVLTQCTNAGISNNNKN